MSDLQEKAAALLARIDDGQDAQRRGGPLSPDDRALILRLGAKGISQTQIAKVVGCHQATVSRTLAQTVVDTDDAAIALKALGKVDVVRADENAGGSSNFVLVVGQPGQSIPEGLEPPVVEIQAVCPDGDAA